MAMAMAMDVLRTIKWVLLICAFAWMAAIIRYWFMTGL